MISYSCCNKLPQTWGHKATEIDPLTILEAKSPRSVSLCLNEVLAWLCSVRSSGGESISCLLQLLMASGFPWLVATSLQSLRPASSNFCLLRWHFTFSVCLPP